jgi:glutamate-ammonia-ligase adenylyltransferase
MAFALPGHWPPPADPHAAARLLSEFTALGLAEARTAASPAPRAMLACLGGNSPYLAGLALRDPDCVRRLVRLGPDAVRHRAMATLARTPCTAERPAIAAALRAAKRHVALATALADLGGLWTLEQVTGALSNLADATLSLAVSHLLHAARADGLRLPRRATPRRGAAPHPDAPHAADPQAAPPGPSALQPFAPQSTARARDLGPGSGFVVLGMGKLGARELNYSSDVDLVLLYDPAAHPYHDAARRAPPARRGQAGGGRPIDLGAVFTRLARGLVTLMATREDGGTVFRVDLRLRPDPGATPPAISLPAALRYYEGMGQNWERAAMIKARPVAGDLALGRAFLDAIRPFVWRRHLDFAAIADIAGMKRRIDRHQRPDAPALLPAVGRPAAGSTATGSTGPGAAGGADDDVALLLGHDLKLGQGGIREIEFLAQTLQLVWGGRNPLLREPRTVPALHLLAAAGHIAPAIADTLDEAYRVLRQAEHRLQMVADRQTHSLPATRAGLDAFAAFLDFADGAALAHALLARLRAVHAAFDALTAPPAPRPCIPAPADAARPDAIRHGGARRPDDRAAAPARDAPGVGVPVPGAPDPDLAALDIGDGAEAFSPATLATLSALGFERPDAAVATLRGWRAGRPRALRSERARALVAGLTPALLAALRDSLARAPAGPHASPHAAGPHAPGAPGGTPGGPSIDRLLARFDALLCALPAGVQLLSLFERNPALLDRVATVLGAAPSLADHLEAVPSAIEGLLRPDDIDPDPARSLALQLRDADTLDAGLGVAQRFLRGEEFRLSCAQLEGRLDPDRAGLARSLLADAVLDAMLPRVLAEHRRRYGSVPGGGMAVVALGKAGGREMMAGSDLDLMLIYHHPDAVTDSDGPDGEGAPASARRVPVSQYYIRAAHALVAALTSPGREGPLYAVDMRLRPSGNKGPVAVSLAGFRRYHAADAWTWERMALTRARVVAGPPALRTEVEAAIRAALATAPHPAAASPGVDALPPGAGVLADAAAMRARLARELPPSGPWDVKHRRGGLMEVEFVAQALQLAHAACHPAVCRPNTTDALRALAVAGVLDDGDVATLVRADLAWRAVQGLLRIAVGARLPDTLPAPALSLLVAALQIPDADEDPERALVAALAALGEAVRAVFTRRVGAVVP